jgi:hypothetical protein
MQFLNKGDLNLPQAAVIAQEYDQVFRPTNPPRPVLRVLVAILVPIGRLLGYRARYGEYSGTARLQPAE